MAVGYWYRVCQESLVEMCFWRVLPHALLSESGNYVKPDVD